MEKATHIDFFQIVLVFSMGKIFVQIFFHTLILLLNSHWLLMKSRKKVFKNLSKCVENFFFHTLGQISSHLDNFLNTWTNFLTMILISIKRTRKFEKALSFTHCSFSVFKKLSLYNLLFLGFFDSKNGSLRPFQGLGL